MMQSTTHRFVIAGARGAALSTLPADLTVGESARACLPLGRRDSAPAQADARRSPTAAPSPLALRKRALGDRPGRPSTGRPLIRSGARHLTRCDPAEAA
jgi:hypothetical protein